jgi:hypothetical protein
MAADSIERLYAVTQIRSLNGGLAVSALTLVPKVNNIYPRAIYVGASGNIVGTAPEDDAAVTLVGLASGIWHPFSLKSINSSTATGILLGY